MAWTVRYVSPAGAGSHDGTAGNEFTLAEAITDAATPHTGYQYNIIAGTYAFTTTSHTFATAGTTTAPNWWRGYKASIGDLDDGITLARSLQDGVNLPLFTYTTGQLNVSGAHNWFSNLDITSQCVTSNGAVNVSGGTGRWANCRVENTAANSAANAFRVATNGTILLAGCRFKSTTTAGRSVSCTTAMAMNGCHIIGGAIGVESSSALLMGKCVIESFATTGVSLASTSANMIVHDCTIYAAATNGVNWATVPTTGNQAIINCIIGGCTNGITAASATNFPLIWRIHFYNCTNNLVNITEMATVGSDLGILCRLIDDDTDPFVAKGSNDFTLASGAIDKSAGFPGVFEGQTAMVSYNDIGAVRHVDPVAGGGGRPEFRGSNL